MFFPKQHVQPGRRFATGATWDDILLGTFGLFAHTVFFLFIGALVQWYNPDQVTFMEFTGGLAALCLFFRGLQVGTTTTKESILAIIAATKERWTQV